MAEGIVYVLINEAMPGYTKIGKTSTSVEQRMKELDTTGVPLPFECYFATRVADMDRVEKLAHDTFLDHRVRQRREFFEIAPERVQSALMLAGGEDVTPREDVVETPDDATALNRARQVRSAFNFTMVNIPIGSTLSFSKDEQYQCVVVENRKVEFRGEITSLSGAALTILQELGYRWKQVAGPDYWMYEGETLTERRLRMEEEG